MENSKESFHQKTVNDPPSPFLVKALDTVSYRDTRELLRRGWAVTAVDASDEGLSILRSLLSFDELQRTELIHSRFAQFQIPASQFDLINASYSLPFCEPERFKQLWSQIISGLKPGGPFTSFNSS